MKTFTIAILAACTFALSAGCTGTQPGDADLDGADEDVASAPSSLEDNSVYSGVWVFSTEACDCPKADQPEYTPECEASDCRESEVLNLEYAGPALRATVRYSLSQQRLSAIGFDADEGGWKLDGAEMTLDLESGVSTFKTECNGFELVMGEDTLKRPDTRLWSAVRYATQHDHWIDVPYGAQ